MEHQSPELISPDTVCTVLQNATKCLRGFSGRIGCTHHVPSKGKILISGDLHNNSDHLSKIIELANLDVPTNHVVFQELIHPSGEQNGLDLSYQMLARVAELVVSYPSQVHPILANHELSQATGRAITKGGGELVEKFSGGVKHVFGDNSEDVLLALYEFIFSMPLAVKSNSGLMCVHSLPNELEMADFDIDILERELTTADFFGGTGSAFFMVWGRRYSENQIKELAERWGVSLFCLGHAWVPEGVEALLPNVVRLNSDHNKGAALQIDLDSIKDAQETIRYAIQLAPHLVKKTEP